MNQPYQSWFITLITEPAARPQTALAAAMYRAVERALFNPRHRLHRQFFDSVETPGVRRRERA
jgi:hypothetical protein